MAGTRGCIVFSEEQRNFLLSPAAKALKPADAAKLKRDEAFDRFKDVRFGWTDGLPICPHCRAEKPYELRKRGLLPTWRCRNKACGKDFSLTSATVFASRKAPLATILHGVAMRLHDPRNILQTSYELGVSYKTAYNWAKSFRVLLGNVKQTRTQDNRWPFLNEDRSEADKLVALVNGAVPRGLPEQIRADVCQDMILGVLTGDITEEGLERQVQKFLRRHYKAVETPFMAVSLNQPVPGTDGQSWGDILSNERYRDNLDRF